MLSLLAIAKNYYFEPAEVEGSGTRSRSRSMYECNARLGIQKVHSYICTDRSLVYHMHVVTQARIPMAKIFFKYLLISIVSTIVKV